MKDKDGWLEVPLRVRYGETDQMGHAYYANYLFWFEVARGEWCRSRGFRYKELEEKGFFLPVVEVWVRFKGEVRYDDDIVILIRQTERRRASLKFEYRVVQCESGLEVTEGYTWHVVMGSSRKAVSIPAWLKEKLEEP